MFTGSNTIEDTSQTPNILNLTTDILIILNYDHSNIDKAIRLLRLISSIIHN